MRKLIRLFTLALLAPSIYSFVYEAYLFLITNIKFRLVNLFIYGFLFYILIYMFILRSIIGFLEDFEHELGHTIVALVFFRRIQKFVVVNPNLRSTPVEETSKVKLCDGTNSLISLAPYYLPVFTIPILIIKPFLFSLIHGTVDFLIGFTLAFHYAALWKEFHLGQTDIKRTGVIFSFCITCILNIIFLIIILCVVLNNYLNILNYFEGSLVRTLESYKTVFQAWRTW